MDLPVDFKTQMELLLGDTESVKLFSSLQDDPPVSIRLNPRKTDDSERSTFNISPQQVLWSQCGRYLPHRLTFTFDPLFHSGLYYVQEASSMFVEQVVAHYVDKPVLALDLCAAPGGKSTHLRSILPEGSLLVANELIRNRAWVLAENLTKWGHPDVIVTNNDPADFRQTAVQFDLILADVPCSGEGMFRKDAGAIDEWSAANVEICRQRQRRIIADIWPNLKPGGLLVYSTCTYNTKENEENIAWITHELGGEPVSLRIPGQWNITGNLAGTDVPVYRFFPHKTSGEGFFMAVVRKDDRGEASVSIKQKKNKKGGSAKEAFKDPGRVKEWLIDPDAFLWSFRQGQITASPGYYAGEQWMIKQNLRIIQDGINLGEVKGKDIIPSHSLALSVQLKDVFAKTEVSYEQAIAFLRKEVIVLPADVPRGYVLICYQNHPLGFVKNIGNRANNLYPPEWRIRSGYLPDELSILRPGLPSNT